MTDTLKDLRQKAENLYESCIEAGVGAVIILDHPATTRFDLMIANDTSEDSAPGVYLLFAVTAGLAKKHALFREKLLELMEEAAS